MKRRLLFILCLSMVSGAVVFGQTRQVTNADLEKYRQPRIQAETDLRENYAKMGFPSPEEIDRRNAESAKQREELSARLRQQRLERERFEAEQQRAFAESQAGQQLIVPGGYDSNLYYGFGLTNRFGGGTRGRRFAGNSVPFGIGWRATPGGVIYEPGGRSSFVWTPTFTRVTSSPRPRRSGGSRRGPR